MAGWTKGDGGDVSTAELLDRFTKAMETLASRSAEATDRDALAKLADAFDRMTAAQQEISAQNTRTQRLIHRPSNEMKVPKISVYNPRGDADFPRPVLKCEYYTPWFRPRDPESLTREETELLNLLEPGRYILTLTDGSRMEVDVTGTKKLGSDTEWDRIVINHPSAFNHENRNRHFPLAFLLREWLKQKPKLHQKALSVLTMDEEDALIAAGKLNDGSAADRVVSVGE